MRDQRPWTTAPFSAEKPSLCRFEMSPAPIKPTFSCRGEAALAKVRPSCTRHMPRAPLRRSRALSRMTTITFVGCVLSQAHARRRDLRPPLTTAPSAMLPAANATAQRHPLHRSHTPSVGTCRGYMCYIRNRCRQVTKKWFRNFLKLKCNRKAPLSLPRRAVPSTPSTKGPNRGRC